MAAPRNLTPLMQKLRNALLGREYKNHLRFEGHGIAKRTQPPPKLPEGVAHKLSQNYYVHRDGRREVKPPEAVYVAGQRFLSDGECLDCGHTGPKKAKTPGPAFNWDLERPDTR